jgi:DNA-binding SARP family transcriptional activator
MIQAETMRPDGMLFLDRTIHLAGEDTRCEPSGRCRVFDSPFGGRLRFSILGPLEIVSDDRFVDIGGPRQRYTLAGLLLDAGRVVSISRLAEAVWETTPPATAKEQIQNDISALRRAFTEVEPDVEIISTRPPGYALEIRDNEVDVHRFNDLVAEARRDVAAGKIRAAAAKMRNALAVWRGPAFDGLSSRLLRAGAARLNETRVALLEECVGLELELGRHRSLIGELTALVTEYPLREDLHAHLMLALYRSGRRAEALEVYRRAHRTFVDELGLDPTSLLRGMEQSMLASDPALDFPSSMSVSAGAVPRQLPPEVQVFGREQHEGTIRAALTEMRPADLGSPRLCVVTGAGGTGKTALAVRSAHAVRASYPDGQLFAELNGSGGGQCDVGAVQGRLLGALGVPVPDSPQERLEAYRAALAERSVLIVLDDVADESTVRPLIPTSPMCGVILTTRSRLSLLPGARRVSLGPLDLSAAVDLLTAAVGGNRVAGEVEDVRQVAELCGRLPLALCGAGSRLAAKTHWTVERLVKVLRQEGLRFDELARGGVPVRDVFATAYERLDPTARLVFRRAGLIPNPSVPAWAFAELAEVTEAEAEAAIEDAVDLWLMEPAGRPGTEPWYGCTSLSGVFARERARAEEPEWERLTLLARHLQQRGAGLRARVVDA